VLRLEIPHMTVAPDESQAGRTVLVLGGGGALGAFQAGGLLALAESGVVPDAVFGCSVGALNGAFLASAPGLSRARELAQWWADPRTHQVLAPSRWGRVLGLAGAGGRALFDERPLRRLVNAHVPAHDIAELAVPLTVTTTCLDCGEAVHHSRGAVGDVLVASCALPGVFPAVRLNDGHLHVDGGIVCGVPVAPALAAAGPHDRVLVLDCGLSAVTGRLGECAAMPHHDTTTPRQDTTMPRQDTTMPLQVTDEVSGCGLVPIADRRAYQAPVESYRGLLQVVLSAFTVARGVANRASVADALSDARVQVLPHVADAWAAGLLQTLPAGPRDISATAPLLAAGHAATRSWLLTNPTVATAHRPESQPITWTG
jgi:predicted acylesterase/phospholipase RssA